MPDQAQPLARDLVALVTFVDARQQRPHVWGSAANDCVAYCLAAVEAQTGEKRAGDLVWSTRAQALKIIKRFGSLEAAFDHYFVRIAPAHAHRGDIGAVADAAFGLHPMIVEGATLVGPGEHGNKRRPRRAMITAWSAVLPKDGAQCLG